MQNRVSYLKSQLLSLPAGLFCICMLSPLLSLAQADTVKKLKEVKVKTNPLPPAQQAVPSQQITSGDFDKYSAFNVADAIRDFSGVNIKDYGGIGGLKTVSVRSLGADHLAVLYDGVEINDAENGEIDLGRFNLENLQSITLYNAQPPGLCMPARSFASGSVLEIMTVRPNLTAQKPYQVILGIKGGSFGLVNPYLQWQQRLSDRWSFVINSYWEKANGRYKYKVNGDGSDTLSTRTNADVNVQEADGALYWAKSDSNKFNLHLNYYSSDRGLPGAVIFYNPISNQRLWNKDDFIQSGYERLWPNSLHLLINGKFSWGYTRYADPDFLNSYGGLLDTYNQYELYQSTALSYHLTRNWDVSYSMDVAYNTLNALDATPNSPVMHAYLPNRFTLLNVFATSYVLGKWRFQGNLLHTYINETINTNNPFPARAVYSPTLMVSFEPSANHNLQLRAFYKDIFRDPTLDEEYYFASDTSRKLKPEFAKQFDAGITYRKALNGFLDYISFTTDGYYNIVTNKIVALPGQNPATASIVNLGKVDITGMDVGVKIQTKESSDGWRGTLAVNYTYEDAIDVTSPTDSYYRQQIPYTPKNSMALNGGVDYKKLGLYYNQMLSSSRYYLSDNTPLNLVDGYSVSDLSLIWKFRLGGKDAVASAQVSNLFNENYVIVRDYPMPGRSVLLSLQIKI